MCGFIFNGMQVSFLFRAGCGFRCNFGDEFCRSIVPFLCSFSCLFPTSCRSLVVFIFHRPAGVYHRSLPITRLLFLSSTCQPPIYPTRGDPILSCLPLIPCRALVDSFLTKREPILGVCGLAAKADLINSARQGQAMGLLRLHNSHFALAYPHHALPPPHIRIHDGAC